MSLPYYTTRFFVVAGRTVSSCIRYKKRNCEKCIRKNYNILLCQNGQLDQKGNTKIGVKAPNVSVAPTGPTCGTFPFVSCCMASSLADATGN
jgi:hypothetical protein